MTQQAAILIATAAISLVVGVIIGAYLVALMVQWDQDTQNP